MFRAGSGTLDYWESEPEAGRVWSSRVIRFRDGAYAT
jgi:hypothetical protein